MVTTRRLKAALKRGPKVSLARSNSNVSDLESEANQFSWLLCVPHQAPTMAT
jgi:hypothetical protein